MSMQLFDLNTTKTFFYKYILSENTNSIQPEPELQNFKWSASQSTVLVPGTQILYLFIFATKTPKVVGYEPAGLTVHPPPKMIEGGFIFFVWVSSVTKIFSSKKSGFCRRYSHWNAPKRGFTS